MGTNKKIFYLNLEKQFRSEKKLLLKRVEKTLLSGNYILSDEVEKFERKICKFLGVKYCISVNSGTDALILSLLSLNIGSGDEVITQSNSYVASAAAIHSVGAKPVFSDVLSDQTMDPESLKKKINSRTKAILPVHLTGRMCEMDKIERIAKEKNLKIIEDSAQAFGSTFKKKKSGTFGDCSAFSVHPLKNLNACGDGGFVTTNNFKLADHISKRRNHGHINRNTIKFWGSVSRLDSIQATILNFRLNNIEEVIKKRINNYKLYSENLNTKYVFYPIPRKGCRDTFHLFVIQVSKREKLIQYLKKNKIETRVHYPTPIHKQHFFKKQFQGVSLPETEKQSKKILSLPINQFLKEMEIKKICSHINIFYQNN